MAPDPRHASIVLRVVTTTNRRRATSQSRALGSARRGTTATNLELALASVRARVQRDLIADRVQLNAVSARWEGTETLLAMELLGTRLQSARDRAIS